jgi:hypothetical protein
VSVVGPVDSVCQIPIGVRGRYNLSKAFYLTAQTDIGGFEIGSDIAWQGYAAVGCQVTRKRWGKVSL